MERAEYFQALRETSDLVSPLIFKYLEEGEFEEPVRTFVEKLPVRRARNPRLRDLLLRLSYEIGGGWNWQEIILPYAAAIELYNSSTYIINWFLDCKGELKDENDRKNAVNAGFLLRELAQEIIGEQKIPKEKTLEIITGLSRVNSLVYRGQNLDLNILTIDHFDKFRDDESFLRTLYAKGKFVCGYFSEWITNVGIILANGNEETKRILGDFAIGLSSGIQLANDAGDFIPPSNNIKTVDKDYKDQVTDIVNGRLTLSTWYCLKHGNQKQRERLLNLVGKKNVMPEEQEQVVYALRDSGAFEFVIKEANRIMNQCKKILKQLPNSNERDLLSTMASVIRTNKFYAILKENYGVK